MSNNFGKKETIVHSNCLAVTFSKAFIKESPIGSFGEWQLVGRHLSVHPFPYHVLSIQTIVEVNTNYRVFVSLSRPCQKGRPTENTHWPHLNSA